jgi:Protein of unknown function (DUF2958)
MYEDIAITNPILHILSPLQLGALFASRADEDSVPVALLRCTCGDFYLLGAIDPHDPEVVFCLYEDSEGVPTLDTVDFEAMYESSEGTDHGFECVAGFVPNGTMRTYYRKARRLRSLSRVFKMAG